MEINQEIKLTVQRLGIQGEGISSLEGYTFFVDGALPGETVSALITERKKNYGKAKLLQVLSPSSHRVSPPCPLFGECGGCQFMHLAYSQQLLAKKQRLVDALERIGKLDDLHVEDCLPSPQVLAYRNKIQLPVLPGEKGIRLGLYATRSHRLIDVEHCLIHCSLGESVYSFLRQDIQEVSVIPYNPETGEGELRHVLIKTAVRTNEVLVVFVTNGPASPELIQFSHHLIKKCPEVKGVVQNIHKGKENVILGKQFILLAGQDFVTDSLCGLSFKISPASFFQVNPQQAERLYQLAIDSAHFQGTETVLDAYCGVGTLSLILSKKVKKVLGVECVPEAIRDARWNALNNQIQNTEFYCEASEIFIQTLKEKVDVILLNPPRKGCDPSFLKGIKKTKCQKIVYISCDPATLARDLAILKQMGYRIERVQPVDMFPQTAHVETVVHLRLRNCAKTT